MCSTSPKRTVLIMLKSKEPILANIFVFSRGVRCELSGVVRSSSAESSPDEPTSSMHPMKLKAIYELYKLACIIKHKLKYVHIQQQLNVKILE